MSQIQDAARPAPPGQVRSNMFGETRINLVTETMQALEDARKTPEDICVIFSASGGFQTDWETFRRYANFKYDGGFGEVVIIQDLCILFKDGTWLARGEYDGSEWWVYRTIAVPSGLGILKRRDQLRCLGDTYDLDDAD